MLKSRDITLPTKARVVKAKVPVVTYSCENWTIKKEEHQRIDAFELEKTPESPLDSKEIHPVHLKGERPWILTGRTDADTEAPVFWLHTDHSLEKSLTLGNIKGRRRRGHQRMSWLQHH